MSLGTAHAFAAVEATASVAVFGTAGTVFREGVVVFVDAFHNSIILSVSGSPKECRR
jgi:hypothetical protein